MNKERRNRLEKLIKRLEDAKTEVEDINSELEDVTNDEEESYENLPDGLKDSERGQAIQEAIDYLVGFDLDFDFDDAIESIQSAIEC